MIEPYLRHFWAVYLHTVYLLRLGWLGRFVPVKYLLVLPHKTTRAHYHAERDIYRISHAMVNRGDELNKRSYYLYSLIAKKYGWRFIKEIYDNS